MNTDAVTAIIAERNRQIAIEGWTPEHDDRHRRGELAKAAGCYAFIAAYDDESRAYYLGQKPSSWPFGPEWWKATERRRDLIKAGALIVAEIERLDRLHEPRSKEIVDLTRRVEALEKDSHPPAPIAAVVREVLREGGLLTAGGGGG